MARAKRTGFAAGAMDGLIAATAVAKGMVVATLNVEDFVRLGAEVVQWRGGEPMSQRRDMGHPTLDSVVYEVDGYDDGPK